MSNDKNKRAQGTSTLEKNCLVWTSVVYIGEGADGKVGVVHIAEERLGCQAEKLGFDSTVLGSQ